MVGVTVLAAPDPQTWKLLGQAMERDTPGGQRNIPAVPNAMARVEVWLL